MSRHEPSPGPDADGYWIENHSGWWGPYDLPELARLADPMPGERLHGVAAGRTVDLGPLVSRRGVGRWIAEAQR